MNCKIYLAALLVAGSTVACSTITNSVGQLTVKDYRSANGQRVMAGQAEPKSAYRCQKVAQEKRDWGLSGNMNKSAAMQRVTAAAVEGAPARSANYAYVIAPKQVSVLGFDVNAFRDAEVAYYRCAGLPSPSY